jgi:hypothetical protein
MTTHQVHNPRLPIRNSLTLFYLLSLLIAVLTVAGSIVGIVYRTDVYPTEELLGSSVANDILNLALGVPLLLASMLLAWRGKLIGLLFWPGALLYMLYNEIGYTFSLPLSGVFPLHLALVPLCAYTVIGLVAAIDQEAVRQRLAGAVPERVVGGILAGLGFLFLGLVISTLLNAILGQTTLTEPVFGTQVADTIIIPSWIVGGILLWRRRALGYVAGLGLLFQGSMLFVAVIAVVLLPVVLLRPLLSAVPFNLADVVVLAVMALVCFIPFGLFVRGVLAGGIDKAKETR